MKFIKYFLGVIIIIIVAAGGAFYFFEDSVVKSVCMDKFEKDKKACDIAIKKSIGTAKEEKTRAYCKETLESGFVDWCVESMNKNTRDNSIPLRVRIINSIAMFLRLGMYSK